MTGSYSMSTGCAVFFPAIRLVFQFFPLGGTTALFMVGGLKKHHLRHLLVPQNIFAKNQNKLEKTKLKMFWFWKG
jgi:hypothetical protein